MKIRERESEKEFEEIMKKYKKCNKEYKLLTVANLTESITCI